MTRRRTATLLIIVLALSCANGALASQRDAQKNRAASEEERAAERQRAQQLWEQAIAAKGGRERLYAVSNLLVSSGYRYKSRIAGGEVKTRFEDFYVFPGKRWSWWDERPTVFGLSVTMWNYERNLECTTYPNDPSSPRCTAPPVSLADSDITEDQLLYLMETRWLKPQPTSVERGRLRGKTVDILHMTINGEKRDFVLDSKAHLPVQYVLYSSKTGQRFSDLATDLLDYAEVDGIQMPRTVIDAGKVNLEVSYQINVEYDEQIFERPPTIEAGPEAWKPKR